MPELAINHQLSVDETFALPKSKYIEESPLKVINFALFSVVRIIPDIIENICELYFILSFSCKVNTNFSAQNKDPKIRFMCPEPI